MPFAKSQKPILVIVFKAIFAVVMLSTLAGLAGSQLAPSVPLSTVLLYCALAAGIVTALLLCAAVLSLTFNQFILRHGGTDTSWFWFKAEPPGLVNQREQLKAENK